MLLLLLLSTEERQRMPGRAEKLDEGLFPRMAAGDTEALAELYADTKSAVYGFVLSILRNPSSAEDVVQDTYVRAYQAAGSYRPQGKPMAWVLTIARNLSLMRLRSRKDDVDELEEGGGAHVTQSFEQDSLNRLILHHALNLLTDGERQVIVLHCISGLKHREIAQLLESPLSTVLSRYNRALKKLRKIIEEGDGAS